MTKFNLTKIELEDLMATMRQSENFELTAPEGYRSDEPDSLGDLDTNEINIDDSRDMFDELENEMAKINDNALYENYNREDAAAEDFYYEDDGQPTEYEEWQDVYGGDDWDHGQYD